MTWEPQYREVPGDDLPDYQPDDDWADQAEDLRAEAWAASRELADAEQGDDDG